MSRTDATVNKVEFTEKLMEIMDWMEENVNEGAYLHLSNELQELFNLLRELGSRKYTEHLVRSYDRYSRRKILTGNLREVKKIFCDRCGRYVVDLKTHQKRAICQSIQEEKMISNKYNTDNPIAFMDCYAIKLQSWFKMIKCRNEYKKKVNELRQKTAIKIQSWFRGVSVRNEEIDVYELDDECNINWIKYKKLEDLINNPKYFYHIEEKLWFKNKKSEKKPLHIEYYKEDCYAQSLICEDNLKTLFSYYYSTKEFLYGKELDNEIELYEPTEKCIEDYSLNEMREGWIYMLFSLPNINDNVYLVEYNGSSPLALEMSNLDWYYYNEDEE